MKAIKKSKSNTQNFFSNASKLKFDCISAETASDSDFFTLGDNDVASTSDAGVVKLFNDTDVTESGVTAVSTTANRWYGVQLTENDKMVVNVPWSSGGTYNWTIKDNATNPASSVVDSGETIQFVTATGALGTALTEPSAGNFVMTLTSPNDNTLYALAGAADGSVAANYNLVLSADGTAQDTMVFKEGSNITFTRAANSLTIAADNDNTTYDFLAVQTGNPASNDDPALRLDPSTGSNDDVTLTGGNNMTITRDSGTQITFDATNTWVANTKTVAGYVAAPGAVANKVWKTNGSGVPAWRVDEQGLTSVNLGATHNASTVVVTNTGGTDATINAATTSNAGVMSSTDKTKLNGIATSAEVNQNAFSTFELGTYTVSGGGTDITANSKSTEMKLQFWADSFTTAVNNSSKIGTVRLKDDPEAKGVQAIIPDNSFD